MAQLLVVILNEPAHLPALLDAWQDIGLPGTTILDSASARRAKGWLHQVGLSAVGELLSSSEVKNKTLFSVIDDDDLLEEAISTTEEIVGGLDVPHRGLLFVVPINRVRGLIKSPPVAENEAEASPPQPTLLASVGDVGVITRNTKVSVVDEILKLKPVIVPASTDLMAVVAAMIQNPSVNIACVVNSRQRLVGLISSQNLADDLFLQIIPEEFLSTTRGLEDALYFADLSRTQTAGDAMIPAVSVKKTDTVRDAFRKMHSNRLSGIPVVNEQNIVTGYINLLELMALYARSQDIPANNEEQK